MFSLYLTLDEFTSKIWFGGYDYDFLKNQIDGGSSMTNEQIED